MGYVMLASALGGLAIDYSTPTPTYHLTDPAVVQALRQTLDLAKKGYIEYVTLKDLMNGQILIDDRAALPTLYEAVGYIYDWDDVGTEERPHLPVTFPQGTEMIPLSYSLGTGYITATTPYADACYRWLSTLAQHPELFNEMPAKRSQVSSDAIIAAHGQRASDFYMGQFALLDDANAVVFPEGNMMDTSSSIIQVWFNRALDAYVLDNADLTEALTQAQTYIDEYTSCISDVVPLVYGDIQSETSRAYYRELALCGVSVDPTDPTMQKELQPLMG